MYNWFTILYYFQVCNIVIQYFYTLQNNHCNKFSYRLLPFKVIKIILSVFSLLYITSLWLITGSLCFLISLTYFTHPPTPLSSGNHLFIFFMSLFLFCCLCSFSLLLLLYASAFPGGAVGKESACHYWSHKRCGFNPWVEEIPWSRKWQPTPVFLPGKFHGQSRLEGYSPWSHKESDMTEHTSISEILRYLPFSDSFHLA